jgi:adenylate cyclase class IV
MELEVVLRDGQGDAEGQAIAQGLMASLGVEKSDLLEGAYMDLLDPR